MKRLLLLPLLFLLTACATGGADVALPSHPTPANFGELLANFKADAAIDLDAADAIAVRNGDLIGHACYPVLKQYLSPVAPGGTVTVDQIKGVFSAYEKARAERMAVESQVSQGPTIPIALKLACSALLLDERNFYIRMAALISGAAVPGVGIIAPLLPK